MWRPERQLVGPRIATADDIPALNRVFADAFTDRYRRDGMAGVRVPQLNPVIWRYAIRDAGQGAMLWYDERGELVAFNIAHCSGREGWMGPLAVRTDRQGMGVGRAIVEAAVAWLQAQGARTLGLETMPRTVENIGFYGRMGFTPDYLTITMTGDTTRRAVPGGVLRLRGLARPERVQLMARCRAGLERAAPGYDYTREMELTDALQIGDLVALEGDGAIAGFALWHSVPLTEGRSGDDLRVLKLFADSLETLERLLLALELCAARAGLRRVAIRCQTAYPAAYQVLLKRGYRVRWTDLRLTLEGYPQPALPGGAVLFSNWEI